MSAKKSFLILSLIILTSCICGVAMAATQPPTPIFDWGIPDNETFITPSIEGKLCFIYKNI